MACFFKKYCMQSPKGYLIAIGGAEDRGEEEMVRKKRLSFFEEGILRQIVELASRKGKPRIEIITTASSIPDEVGLSYKKAFRKLGVEDAGHLKLLTRDEAELRKNTDRVERCNCLLFSGGDQLKLL
jgi:cyanophycinase